MVYIYDMQGGLKKIEESLDRSDGSIGVHIFEVAAEYYIFYTLILSVGRYDHDRTFAGIGHIERIASHKDLFQTGCASNAHDHHIDALVANYPFQCINERRAVFYYEIHRHICNTLQVFLHEL